MKNNKLLGPNDLLRIIYGKISKNDKIAFIFGFIMCLACHMFMYTNSIFVYDSAQIYNVSNGIANGRFMVALIMPLFNRMQIPWIIGLVTAILVGLTTVFTKRVLHITHPGVIIAAAGVIASFPAFIASHLFFSSIPIYAFSMLFAVLTAYFYQKNTIKNYFFGSLFLVLSLGCYQAYLETALVLIVLSIIFDVLTTNVKTKQSIIHLSKSAIATVISATTYYGIWQMLIKITNTSTISYRGEENIAGELFNGLFGKLIVIFASGYKYVFDNTFNVTMFGYIMQLAVVALTIVSTIYIAFHHKLNGNKMITVVFLSAFLPLLSIAIYIISPYPPYSIMLPGLIFPSFALLSNLNYIYNLNGLEKPDKNYNIRIILSWMSVIVLISYIASNFVYANSLYIKEQSDYNSSMSYCTRLIDRIEQIDGVTNETDIIIIGDSTRIKNGESREWAEEYAGPLDGVSYESATPFHKPLIYFIRDDINSGLKISSGNIENMEESPYWDVLKSLDAFPAANCTVWVDGKLIIKL